MTSMPGLGIVTRTEMLLKRGFALLTGHNLLSVAVIEHVDQKQLEEERDSLAYTQDHHLSLREGTGTQAGAEAGTIEESCSLACPPPPPQPRSPNGWLSCFLKTQDLTHEP